MNTPPIDPDGVYLLKDLPRYLKVSRRTLERLRAHRALPLREMPALDKRPRFSGAEILRFIHSGRSLLRRAG